MKKEELYDIMGGIDEKFINEAEDIHVKKKLPLWMKGLALAACLCLCFCCSISVLAAAGNNKAYEVLYSVSPYIAQKLKPINVSCEDNGIEMTVVAAEVDGENTTILVAMRDCTEERLDETTDLFDSYGINTPYDQTGGCWLAGYDDDTKTATFMLSIEQMNHVPIPGDKITFSVSQLLSKKEHSKFIFTKINTESLPLITEFVTNPDVRGWSINESTADIDDIDPDNLLCMKPDKANEISLREGVTLTGYGIVDGKLHIQIRYDDISNTDNHGYVYLKNQEGKEILDEFDYAFWDDDYVNSYDEYVFSLPSGELGDYEIGGEFWTCNQGPIKGNWQITFPISKEE